MITLELKNIGKKFPQATDWAVKNFDLVVEKGDIVALLGESGCGKTTILRMIAGFERPTEGFIKLHNKTVADEKTFIAPQKRNVGIVFQDYALFPHKTVWENIGFGLSKLKKEEKEKRIHELLTISGLAGLEKRYPHQLSGGQQQRVALARALAPEPGIILFDEPFSNLDSFRKNAIREHLREIIRKTSATAVFVTHDTKDVLSIADKVAVIRNGKAIQTGKPQDVYNFPSDPYVANFFGKTNIIKAKVTENGFLTPMGLIKADTIPVSQQQDVFLSIRPEQFYVLPRQDGCMCGNIIKERFLGEYKELTCKVETPDGDGSEVVIYTTPQHYCDDNICYFRPKEGTINILR